MKELDLEVAGGFIPIAAAFFHIKSPILFPVNFPFNRKPTLV